MMIECPKCGFAQPRDRYCASCGVDMEHLLAVPDPLWVRILQNPTLHLSLIGMLIALVVGWIFYTQSALVSREVGALLDLPLSSREAADPETADTPAADVPDSADAGDPAPEIAAAASVAEPVPEEKEVAAPVAKKATPTRVEVTFWEVPREALNGWLSSGERVADSSGRAFLIKDGAKLNEALQAQGQNAGGDAKSANLQNAAQVNYDSPVASPDALQFGFSAQVNRDDKGAVTIRWDSNLVPPPAGGDPAQALSLEGSSALAPNHVILLVYEPAPRALREEAVIRLGDGPWMVLGSPEFRSGLTDWIAAIQLK